MAEVLNAKIAERIQELAPDTLVDLYQIDATALGIGILYFTSTAYPSANIIFDGQSYTPIEFEANGFEWSAKGALPTPTIKISNATGIVSAAVISAQDLLGAVLTRIRTFARHLDDGSDPDVDAIAPPEIYNIERKSAQNKHFIEWELSAVIDQEGRFLPGRQALKTVCPQNYRIYTPTGDTFDYSKATCPYVGTGYYKKDGTPTTKQNDKCGKRLSDCRLRFGEKNKLYTWAMPGIGQGR